MLSYTVVCHIPDKEVFQARQKNKKPNGQLTEQVNHSYGYGICWRKYESTT